MNTAIAAALPNVQYSKNNANNSSDVWVKWFGVLGNSTSDVEIMEDNDVVDIMSSAADWLDNFAQPNYWDLICCKDMSGAC